MPKLRVLDRGKEGFRSFDDKMYCISVSKIVVKRRRKTTRTYQFQSHFDGLVKYRRKPRLG